MIRATNGTIGQMIAWAARHSPAETSGFGWIENGEIVRIFHCQQGAIKTAGHVDWDTNEVTLHAMKEGLPMPNMQWHTHPGFSPFWSGTDLNQQNIALGQLLTRESGNFVFIVHDGGMQWNAREFTWTGRGNTSLVQRDGCVHVGETPLKPVAYQSKWMGGGWGSGKDDKKGKGGKGTTTKIATTPLGLNGLLLPSGPPPGFREETINGISCWVMTKRVEELWYMSEKVGYERTKYDKLFEAMKVPFYDWEDLWETIELEFPNYYSDILDNPDWWEQLPSIMALTIEGVNNGTPVNKELADATLPAVWDDWY